MSKRATYASDTPLTVALADALAAGAAGAVLSGVPSTAVTVARRGSLLDGATAAGSILMPGERRTLPLVAAAVPVHLALSFGWAAVMSVLLPRRATVPAGVAGGPALAPLDPEPGGRAFPAPRRARPRARRSGLPAHPRAAAGPPVGRPRRVRAGGGCRRAPPAAQPRGPR